VSRVEVLAVSGIGEVEPGDDLAAVIANAAPWLVDGDVLVVTSKIVSKSEGQLVDVPADGPERDAAREAVLAAETVRTVAQRGPVRIVQTHHGFVMAAAGIDASNVDASRLVLLPKDPDASARALRSALRERFGLDVAVVVTDTMGRPWRLGLTDVAIGAAGIEALTDYRGMRDAHGNELQITQMAVIDELAGAAELVKGKSDQVPVAVVRGVRIAREGDDGLGAAALVRGADDDLFSLGTAEAKSAGMREVAGLPDAAAFAPGPVKLGPVPFPRLDPGLVQAQLPPNTAEVLAVSAPDGDPWTVAQTGAQVQRLRATLAADGLASAWVRVEVPGTSGVPLGVLAIGHPA
jgi:coenzyme F420-0:L-glutamate ligase/coenzyme F420-1:gamma-L-glutamate ligase